MSDMKESDGDKIGIKSLAVGGKWTCRWRLQHLVAEKKKEIVKRRTRVYRLVHTVTGAARWSDPEFDGRGGACRDYVWNG
jgi:hypothetical protein